MREVLQMEVNETCESDSQRKETQHSEVPGVVESAPTDEGKSPLEVAERVQALFAGRMFSDSAELIREDRRTVTRQAIARRSLVSAADRGSRWRLGG